jgi:hypothetical protein
VRVWGVTAAGGVGRGRPGTHTLYSCGAGARDAGVWRLPTQQRPRAAHTQAVDFSRDILALMHGELHIAAYPYHGYWCGAGRALVCVGGGGGRGCCRAAVGWRPQQQQQQQQQQQGSVVRLGVAWAWLGSLPVVRHRSTAADVRGWRARAVQGGRGQPEGLLRRQHGHGCRRECVCVCVFGGGCASVRGFAGALLLHRRPRPHSCQHLPRCSTHRCPQRPPFTRQTTRRITRARGAGRRPS